MKFLDNALNALYEDNHLLVVNKPAGMLTQGNEVEDGLEEILKKSYRFLHSVHRLDRPVSGIVVFAKSSKALSRLNASQRDGKWTKKYLARVEGKLEGEKTLTHRLIHGDRKAEINEDGKLASLHYTVIQNDRESSLLEITLQTGRYHQIRIQLSSIGHPILGDKKYGSTIKRNNIALCHHFLSFPHPVKPENILITCDAKI